ncbi:MAG: hypothetical protein LBR36_04435 [Bacteroidales bacterium]|jgi:hypothetical protein|nr:hypothetical protein [Bacteroidales bacterium]
MEDNQKKIVIEFSEEEIKKLKEFVHDELYSPRFYHSDDYDEDEQLTEEEVGKMWLEKFEFLKKLQVKIEEGECLDFSEMD